MNEQQKATDQQTQFMIQRLFLKDSSFEAPNSPEVFKQEWKPELSLDLHTENKQLEPNVYQVVLTLTATVKNKNETAFLIEVKQAGIFSIEGAPKDQLAHLLGSYCPNILFPYARERISSMAVHGSFPQLILAPINFDALYMQQLQEKQKAAGASKEKSN